MDEFQQDPEKYIEEYDLITFAKDVDTLAFLKTVVIEHDIEMKSASGTKVKIACTESVKFVFSIK